MRGNLRKLSWGFGDEGQGGEGCWSVVVFPPTQQQDVVTMRLRPTTLL
jgi:hypothetical protein